ncbi:MAG: acyltransferase family protein [Gammaproteobacteria bacterium]
MTPAVSLYLDLVRFFAAFVVLLSHFGYARISGGEYLVFRRFGSDAVVLFFVLSGYVIAYVAAQREHNLREYTVSRLARLYSVALPALVVTVVLDQIGQRIDPGHYKGWWYAGDGPLGRFLANLFFVNQLWFNSVRPFSNGPYWSLGYEFWYYALFGIAYYLRGRRRALLLVLAGLVIGPKVLLQLPVWLLGVWTYHYNRRSVVPPWLASVLFLAPFVVYPVIKTTGWDIAVREWTLAVLGPDFVLKQLRWSDEFVISQAYAVLIAMNFVGAQALGERLGGVLRRIERPIRYWAGFTFSMYLFHYPLLQFFAAVYGSGRGDAWRHALLFGSTVLCVVVLGYISEHRKRAYQRFFTVLLERVPGSSHSSHAVEYENGVREKENGRPVSASRHMK